MTRYSLTIGVLLMIGMGQPSILAAAPAVQALGKPAAQVPTSACTMGRRMLDGLLGNVSFEKFADGAKVIVEAYVQSVAPGADLAGTPEKDVLLIPARVLKGPGPLGQFAVSQTGASMFFEMQPGQHFILFLTDPNPAGAQRYPERPGVSRYNVNELATLCVDAGRTRVIPNSPGNSMRPRFDGAELEKVVTDIRTYVGSLRVNGRIGTDSGEFPLAGSRWTVPTNDFDLRSNLKLVFTPIDVGPGGGSGLTIAAYAPPGTLPDTISNSGPRLLSIDRNGVFTIPLEEGTYRITVDGIPFGYYLKSLSYGSRDLLQQALQIDRTVPAATELLVTLTDKAPAAAPAGMRVSGHVTGIPAGLALDRLWVVMISDAVLNARAGAARPSQDGTFELLNVPPGNYTLKTFQNISTPQGTAWGVASTASVVVSNRDVTVEIPLFAGAAVTARFVDKDGNSRTATPPAPRLTFTPIGSTGTPINMIPAPDGTFRLWLPRGEYWVTSPVPSPFGNVTSSVKGISSGSVDLYKETLKSDGVTPIAPILIMVE